MSMQPLLGVFGRRDAQMGFVNVALGATGAVSATQENPQVSGITSITRQSAGRYKFQIGQNGAQASRFPKFLGAMVIGVRGPATAVYGAKTTGLPAFMRTELVDGASADGSFIIQFVNPSTDATNYIDADPPDNVSFDVLYYVSKS